MRYDQYLAGSIDEKFMFAYISEGGKSKRESRFPSAPEAGRSFLTGTGAE